MAAGSKQKILCYRDDDRHNIFEGKRMHVATRQFYIRLILLQLQDPIVQAQEHVVAETRLVCRTRDW